MSLQPLGTVEGIICCSKSDFDRLKEENKRLKAENQLLKQQLKQKVTLINEKDELIKEQQNSIKRLIDEDIARIKVENDALKAENHELRQRVTRLEVSYSNLDSRLTKTISDLSDTKSEISEMNSKLSDTKSELSDTKSELSVTKLEISETKSELSQTKSELSDVSTELKDLRDKTKQLEERSVIGEAISNFYALFLFKNIDDASIRPFFEIKKINGVELKQANQAQFIQFLKIADEDKKRPYLKMIEEFSKNKITYDELQNYYRSIVSSHSYYTMMHPLKNIVVDADQFYQDFLESISNMRYYQDQAKRIYDVLLIHKP